MDTAREGNKAIEKFESAVFDGIYLTGDESAYLAKVANVRSDQHKKEENQTFGDCQIDLHNNN